MKHHTTIVRSFISDERGAAAVEFGLIAMVFLSLVIAMFAFGLFFLTKNRLQEGVEEAARYAAVHTSADDDELEDVVRQAMDVIHANNDNLSVDFATSVSNGVNFLEVSATYDFDWNLPFVPASLNDFVVSASARTAR